MAARAGQGRGRRRGTPEQSVAQLDGGVPVTLLPVRLETRFGEGNTTLRIRVYPEQLHVDAHEPELTAEELAAATTYWRQRWDAGADAELAQAAWLALAKVARPTRARWLVSATTPTNLDALGTGEPVIPTVGSRPAPWTRAAQARLLPQQWVAVGYRGGGEVFRVWGEPIVEPLAVGLAPDLDATDDDQPIPVEQEELPIDEGIRWLVDYEAARTAGMAVTVTDGDLTTGTLGAGLDELLVLGVDWTRSPDAAAEALSEQLARHAVSDGLALLASGTPTNNTDEDRAASGTDPSLDLVALDPTQVDAGVQAEAERLSVALGLPGAGAFAAIPGRGHFDDGPAADMNNALWASTIGYFLEQMMRPVVPSRTITDVADHFRRHVRGRGPFAAVRVGRQPYGVLPVVAGEVTSGDPFEVDLASKLRGLAPFWANAARSAPQLGNTDRPDADLVELLRRTPRSHSFRFREAAGMTLSTSMVGFGSAAAFQEHFANVVLALTGIQGSPELARVTVAPAHRSVPVPLVQRGALSETERLDPNYIEAVAAETRARGGLRRLIAAPGKAGSLLEALLRHSASLEYAIGSVLIVIGWELETGVLAEAPVFASVADRELFGVAKTAVAEGGPIRAGRVTDASRSMLASSASVLDVASAKVEAISGDRSLADHLAELDDERLLQRTETARFGAFRQSLDRLAAVPTAELGRLAADTLDCASHRLDAWFTSLASRRLADLRADQVTGTHIGAFGFVEDLAPRTSPGSLGYLQAPSIAHATTASVLRSGHLARRADTDGPLALDLTSARVSLALELIEGVRRGQPIGALLGYRFERGLRDRRITLAKYILPFRQAAPLAQVDSGPVDDGTSLEAIAARDVVDGVRLLQLWKRDGGSLFAGLSLPVEAGDRADVDAELRRLDDALDAVSDVLVAESVHQAVLGNAERSAAALDALDRQTNIPDIAVVRTPRTGRGANHRLLLLLQDTAAAPGWDDLDDPRRRAEPRVDAWVGAVLGDPGRYRFGGEALDADGVVVQRFAASLPDLGLSAVSTAVACATGPGASTELEERLALLFSSFVTADDAERLVLLDDPPDGSPPDALGLRDLLELGAQVLDLLASGRHADQRALAPDTERVDAGVLDAELRARADRAVDDLRTALGALDAADPDTLVGRLLAAADAGARAGVPAGGDLPALEAQAASVVAAGRRLLERLDASEAELDRSVAEPAGIVAHDLGRIRSIFGEGFPVVATFAAAIGSELEASRDDPALLTGDSLAPAGWLAQHSAVRAAASRLHGVLTGAELLGGGTGLEGVWAAQLPHVPGDRWLARPGPATAGNTSLVVHSVGALDLTAPVAGLVLDQWSDVVPNEHETTGLSFHYDAPGARAPQTILVAVPGDREAPSWTVELLAGTVREAMALSRMRALDADDLDVVGRFLPAIYLPFNIESKTPSVNLSEIITSAVLAENAVFLAGGQ